MSTSAEGNERREELIRLAQAGDREARGVLLHYTEKMLRSLVHRFLERHGQLRPKVGDSDLYQDIIVAALAKFDQFRGQTFAEFMAWLRCIGAHLLSNLRRRYYDTAKRDVRREVSLEAGPRSAALADKRTARGAAPGAARFARKTWTPCGGPWQHYRRSTKRFSTFTSTPNTAFRGSARRWG